MNSLATAERDSALPNAKPHRRACRRQDNPMPFNDSDTALRGSALLQSEAKPQVVSEAKDNFRKDDDVRWQPSGARSTAKGSPQGERGGVHQFGVPPKSNANFASVQHFIPKVGPHGMAGFNPVRKDLANGRMSSNQSGECVARSASSKPEAKLHGRGRQRDTHRALIEADREMRNNEIRTTNRAFPTSTFELPPSKLAAPLPGRLFYCRPKVDRTDGFHRTQRHPTTAGPSIR